MSNQTEEGVQDVKTAACDKLLQARVDARMAGKKVRGKIVPPVAIAVVVIVVCKWRKERINPRGRTPLSPPSPRLPSLY